MFCTWPQQLWSLERKKHWDYEANYFFLLCSLQTLFSSRLADLCYFPKFDWPTMHRHSLLFPRPAGASINGGFLLLHFQYWRWYALFMFLVSLTKFPEIFLFPFMEIFASHDFCIMFSPYDFHYLSLYIYIYIYLVLNSKVCIFNLNKWERERERERERGRKVLFFDI